MTAKEAIEVIEVAIAVVEWEYPLDYAAAIEMAIEALEKQIPKKPYKDNENGVYEKDYCPTCNRSLFPNDHHCRCGQAIDWSEV